MPNAHDIIQRVTTDSAFADEIRNAAESAAKEGVSSEAHRKLLNYFANSPEELENMFIKGLPVTAGFTTTTTTTTFTTAACTTTGTTTTTTGN